MNLYTYLEQLANKQNEENQIAETEKDGRTILIYHGLNGGVDNKKINHLEKKGFHVIMHKHDYRMEYGSKENPWDLGKSFMKRQEVVARNADIILGTSFGGYVAYLLGCQLHKDVILINAALNRSVTLTGIQDFDYPLNEKQAKRIEYFHGTNDTTVNASKSLEILKHPSGYYKEIKIPGMEHSVPLEKFKQICEQSYILSMRGKKEDETIRSRTTIS